MVFRVLCDGEYAIMRKRRWCNFGEKGWRRRALQEFPRTTSEGQAGGVDGHGDGWRVG